jgi:hypothetical protein
MGLLLALHEREAPEEQQGVKERRVGSVKRRWAVHLQVHSRLPTASGQEGRTTHGLNSRVAAARSS